MKLKLSILILIAVASLLATGMAHAYLLDSYFGVNPTLTYISNWNYGSGTYSAYEFTPGSLNPTLHTSTANTQINDWFGRWDGTVGDYTNYPGTGTYPSGEEPYDTEAYYFDNDANNLYFAVVMGFPSPTSGIYQEDRLGVPVVQGDFAIDLPHTTGGQTDNWGFQYNYGVNITPDVRPASGNVTSLYSNTLGNTVYNTTSGWYLGTPTGAVNPTPTSPSGSFTNFDPAYNGGAGMTNVGTATTNWYQLNFAGGNLENKWQTYVLEITIPRSILPNLGQGDWLRYHWLAGCRNDGNDNVAYMTGNGDVGTPEPGTLALMLTAVGPLGLWLRKRRNQKT